MGCRDYGDKPSRHSQKVGPTDVDQVPERQPIPGVSPINSVRDPSNTPTDPYAAFLAAKSQSYEEMKQKREFHQRLMDSQQAQLVAEMSDAMRRIHVDELISVVNCDKMGVPGMTPGQAVTALHDHLACAEFKFIEDLYPGLTKAVEAHYSELLLRRLPGPRNK